MLRLGTKVDEPTYGLDNPFEKLELRYEEADEELKELYEEYKQLDSLPLVTNVKRNLGLVGNRYVISKQMKNILMQSIFNHSYLDLQIIVVTDETYLDDYKYTFSVNHYNTSEDERKLFIHDATSRDRYLNGFTSLLRMRDMEYKPGMQFDKHMLFIIDNPSLINNHPIMEFLEKEEERLGMSIIQVAKASNELPKHIKTVVEYKTNEKAELVLENGILVNKEFTLPQIDKTKEELELYYRKLSNLAILGSNYHAVVTKLFKDYSNKSFIVFNPNNELKLKTNATLITLNSVDEISKGDIVILHGLSELDKLSATERREKQDLLNSLDNVVIAIQTEKHRFTCKQMKEIKEFKRYVICGSYEDESVMSVYKRPSRKMTAFKLTPKQVLEVNDKEMKTIKL